MGVHLRDYQTAAVDEVYRAFNRTRRVLLVSPTGSGKTVMFAHIAHRVYEKQNSAIMLAHRIEIVNQISAALTRAGVRHGVMAPGHRETTWPCQVAMVQTLANRIQRIPRPKLLIIDEAHHAVAGSYRKIADEWPDLFTLGVTASPARLDGKGLGECFDVMVHGPSVIELISRGYLSGFSYFAPPIAADLSGLKTARGDYVTADAAAAMDKVIVTGDAEKHYRKLLNGRPAVAFCSSVEHAKHVADEFTRRGWKAASVDGAMDSRERAARIAAIGNGDLNVLTSCDIVSEGTDIPVVSGAILLRPTQSLVIFLQQVGRVLRPKPDGSKAVILDHVGSVSKFGLPDAARTWSLEGVKSRQAAGSIRQCPDCYLAHAPCLRCPACGHTYEVAARARLVSERAGELQEVTSAEPPKPAPLKEVLKTARTKADLQAIARERNYHPRWVQRMMLLKRIPDAPRRAAS